MAARNRAVTQPGSTGAVNGQVSFLGFIGMGNTYPGTDTVNIGHGLDGMNPSSTQNFVRLDYV